MTLPNSFYWKRSEELARDLLGCILIHEAEEGMAAGVIVETEAYHQEDPASHSYSGRTPRTEVMFGPPGRAYIYFTYGMHHCFNVVCGQEGRGEAVLIRALEPVEGIELMQRRRKRDEVADLCSGPAKLVEALGISKEQNGCALAGDLRIELGEAVKGVVVTRRVGISKAIDEPLRFYVEGNEFISRR